MPPPAQRRAVLYGRVSKATRLSDTGERHQVSVDQQLDEMRRWAARDSVEIVGVHRDDGVSASRFARGAGKERDGWRRVMEALASGQATELWAWEISRATRDRPVWAKLVSACIAQDIKISVGGKLHDPADSDDGFMLDLMAALAVRESAKTSERIQRDVRARATAGLPHGKIPFGYRRRYDERSGALLAQELDPVTAPVVAEMAARILAGESMYAIAQDLNARAVPSPDAVRKLRVEGPDADVSGMFWRGDEVRDQVLSPAAAGQRVHKGIVVADAAWPAIISLADHTALIAMLRGPHRNRYFGPAKHLLSGIAECGVCHSRLRAVHNRSYPSYGCPGPQRRGSSCVIRQRGPLDAMAVVRVVERLEDPEFLAQLVERRSVGAGRAASVGAELRQLRERLDQYVAAAAGKTGLAADTFARAVDDLAAQIEAKKAELTGAAEVPAVVLNLAGPGAAERWDALDDVDAYRVVIRTLLRVVVHKSTRPRGSRGFDASSIELIDL